MWERNFFSKIFAVENLKSYFNFSRQTLALLGVLFLVVVGIAATVLVAQQQQEIRKRAAHTTGDTYTYIVKRSPPDGDVTVGQSVDLSGEVNYSNGGLARIILWIGKLDSSNKISPGWTELARKEPCEGTSCQITKKQTFNQEGKWVVAIEVFVKEGDGNIASICKSWPTVQGADCGSSGFVTLNVVSSTAPSFRCIDITDGTCDDKGCENYSGIGPNENKKSCSIKNDQCLRNLSFDEPTCTGDPNCEWHKQRGICYTKNENPQPPPPQQGNCIDISVGADCGNKGCESYFNVGLGKDKNVCSIKEDKCIKITDSTICDLNKQFNSCEWNERGFCYTKQQQAPPPPVVKPPSNNGGSPAPGTNQITPIPSTSCRVSWTFDPNPETSPANTSFRAYIKGQSSTGNDWGYIRLKFDNGNLGAISDIKTSGSLGPLTNCSTSQPCFQSNVLNSVAANSPHTLTFSINNPEPENPNGVSINCTPAKTFVTAGGGTITPIPPGGGGAKILPALNLEGFTGTYTPKRDTEALTVLLRSQAGTLTAVETVATFSATHRHFRKLVDLPADLPDGIYELLLKGASTLRRSFGNITITKNRETFVPFDPAKPLLACDLDNNNLINISDINQIYTDIKKPKAEHKDSLADITRDGVIDIFDHNYCVQNFLKEGEKP